MIPLIVLVSVSTVAAQQVTFTHRGDLLKPVSGFTAYADCVVDMNADGRDDVVRVGAKGMYIDYQQPDGSFAQKFIATLISTPPTWSICAGDLDNNGFNDLLFADTDKVAFLMANQTGTHYSESVMPADLISQRSTMADINSDGWLDAFVCNDTSASIPFRNAGWGEMLPDTNLIRTSHLPGSYSAIWVDYNDDGATDIYVSKCLSGAPPGAAERTNLLYRNNGDGTFSEIAAAAGVADNAQSWSTSFEDFDNDGDMDAFVVNHDFQNRLYRNNSDGTFTDVIDGSGIDAKDLGAFENASGDFNNDGFVDIFSDFGTQLYLGHGDLTFAGQNVPVPAGALGDLNDDGFLDIVHAGQVWLNNGNDTTHWLKVVTAGLESNRSGIGARVEVYTAGRRYIREVRSGQSYSPMSSLTAHVGLGSAQQVDSLVVRWPSGIVTVMRDLPADRTYVAPEVVCALTYSGNDEEIALCPGDSLMLEAPTGFTGYEWSTGELSPSLVVYDPGKYSVLLKDELGCIGIQGFDVVEARNIPPKITAAPARRSCVDDQITLIATHGQNPVWSNGAAGSQIIVSASDSYTVSVDAACGDEKLVSAPFEVEYLTAEVPDAPDIGIVPGDSVMLVVGGEDCHWYDQPAGGNLLHSGCVFQTGPITSDTTFFVESRAVHSGEEMTGGLSDTLDGGGVSQQTGFMHFEAWEPFTLVSVRVYLPEGMPGGSRFVQLISSDTILAFKQFDIATGWNELELNFQVPVGAHALHCPLGNLYRDIGDFDYPFAIGNAAQITTSSFGDGYYYYFYDWKIRTHEITCISERTPIVISTTRTSNPAERQVEVYPNPTASDLTIRFWSGASDGQIRLLDLNGRLILQRTLPGTPTYKLNISDYPPGLYWLEVVEGIRVTRHTVVLMQT